ncbi:MAG: phosphoglycerate dehydrogenase [SAR324 cluster bacterium]|nr:phosphoglycerate dehydrogenase [SAR324 cluster bacterium]
MFKILTLNQISVNGLERFSREKYEIASEIRHPDAILVRSQRITPEELSPTLRGIARAGAGVNNIPVGECTKKGITVFNTPGANANAVKELVVTALLLSSRDILGGIDFVKQMTTQDPAEMHKVVEKQKKMYKGEELAGKTLGVIGLGAIGSSVAETALRMGMKVLGYDPGLSVEAAWKLSGEIQKMENLPSLVSKSDYVTLHLPALESTRYMINKDMLASFKKGCRLMNFSRAEIVEIEALVDALESGQLSRYATDFPHPSLLGRADTILIPHLGASTEEAEDNCAVMAANQIIDFLENGNIKNSVNFPNISLDRNGGHRIAISNQNIPKMLGKALAIIADRNINVSDMINKSRDDIAYNLIDLETPPPVDLKEALEGIEGVISVRYL